MKKENITFYGYISFAKGLFFKEKNNKDIKNNIENIFKEIDFEKTSNTWYGKVLLEGKKGLVITNRKDTRNYISKLFLSIA